MNTFISFQGVALRAYDRIVFPKTDWAFCAHQHWALYGANGSGKSILARALVKNPQLLVLDEPCQGLDERNRRQIIGLVEAVGRRMDTGIIYVTHDIDELPDIITHVLRLEDGKAVEIITRELRDGYTN